MNNNSPWWSLKGRDSYSAELINIIWKSLESMKNWRIVIKMNWTEHKYREGIKKRVVLHAGRWKRWGTRNCLLRSTVTFLSVLSSSENLRSPVDYGPVQRLSISKIKRWNWFLNLFFLCKDLSKGATECWSQEINQTSRWQWALSWSVGHENDEVSGC